MRPRLNDDAEPAIKEFIRSKVEETSSEGVVVGLSGGIDSALVSKLCCDALGPERVLNIFMPSKSTPDPDRRDVEEFCDRFGMELRTFDISEVVSCFCSQLPSAERLDLKGNVMARARMVVLFHHANLMSRLVMGTGNKSELLIGYFTKFGDGASDFGPIGDLYKTEVWELASRVGVPERIVNKVPCAGLWEGQTDEGEMGVFYEDLDSILMGIEGGLSVDDIVSRTGMDRGIVEKVWRMHLTSAHKRKAPLIPKLGLRTIGLDWRE
ncbi:MAG: NAD+ synthase [Methanomassiliicoccales archaeon]